MEQLDQIANVIGESYATADLSDLLSFLKKDPEEEPVEMKEEEEIEEVKQELRMVETNHYKIKCHILRFFFSFFLFFFFFFFHLNSLFLSPFLFFFNRTLATVSSYRNYFRVFRNPTNLFFTELLISHKDNLITFNDNLKFIFLLSLPSSSLLLSFP